MKATVLDQRSDGATEPQSLKVARDDPPLQAGEQEWLKDVCQGCLGACESW